MQSTNGTQRPGESITTAATTTRMSPQAENPYSVTTNSMPPSDTTNLAVDLESGKQQQQDPNNNNHGHTDGLHNDTHGDDNNNNKNAPTTVLPRLVLRNRPFHQSSNKVHIQHNLNGSLRIYSLLKHNWFHFFLRWPTSRSMLLLMSAWTGAILLFAGVYVWYDNLDVNISCGLGKVGEPMQFGAAFAFSLETCTTVGT